MNGYGNSNTSAGANSMNGRRKGVRTIYGEIEIGLSPQMPRPKRADEKNAIYHALNRGNGRSVIFHEDADYEAFESILAEALVRYPCRILSYQLMPNHWHFVLQPTEDGGMSNFMRWVTLTHTMRYHALYDTAGEGHVY